MKKTSLVIAALVLFVLSAAAQDRVLARAHVPFGFTAHEQSFDRGDYELRQIGAHTIRLQQTSTGRGVTLLSSQDICEGGPTRIVFRDYGDTMVLSAVRAPSYEISLPKTLAKSEIAAAPARTVTVLFR